MAQPVWQSRTVLPHYTALAVALAPALAPALALVFGSFAEPTQAQSPSFFSAGVHQMPRQRRR